MKQRWTCVIIFLIVLLANNWWWQIFHLNRIVSFLGFFLAISFLLFNGWLRFFLIPFLFFLIFLFLFSSSNRLTVFSLTDSQIYLINERRAYYSYNFLGRFFENKPNYYFFQWQKNFFESFDPNLYFFSGHPRERPGVWEFDKFPFLYLPFFLWGFFRILNRKDSFFLLLYPILSIVFISFFKEANNFLFLLFPWFVIVLYFGFEFFLPFLSTRFNHAKK